MLKLFRTDVYLQAVIIAVVAALLWVRAIVAPPSALPEGGGSLFYFLFGWMSPRTSVIVALLLSVVEGILLNAMFFHNKMINQGTLLPMLFFLLATGIGVCFLGLTPLLAGTFFIILCVGQLMITGTLLSLPIDKTFGAAACLSLATLFCPTAAVFLLPLMMSMLNYSLYSWRDWTMLLLGFAAPYIPLELYWFLSGDSFYQNYLLLYSLTDIALVSSHSAADWAMSASFLFFTLVAVIVTAFACQSHGTNYTKNATAILFFLVGSLLYAAYSTLNPVATQAYAIPFAFSASALFYDKKNKEWPWNIALILILLAAIAYNLVR